VAERFRRLPAEQLYMGSTPIPGFSAYIHILWIPIYSLSFPEQLDDVNFADVFVACFYQFCSLFDVRCDFARVIIVFV
jgi:hypothetical protein